MKLRSLTANFEEFHSVEFSDGLNVIIAERAKQATRTDSRNGLGKTTTIALIDFCLGANMSDRIKQMVGRGWLFSLELTTRRGFKIRATRGPDSSGEIYLEGDVAASGIAGDRRLDEDGGLSLGVRQWTSWLGSDCFTWEGMPVEPPSFRSLMRHFVRFKKDAFLDPFKTTASPRSVDVQSENAYLLNLDWRLAKDWAQLKDRKSRVALADDPDNSIDDQIASLESQLARQRHRTVQLESSVSTFSVLPEYREVEENVQRLTGEIKKLTNENLLDHQQLDLYQTQAEQEFLEDTTNVEALFAEAGVVLGDAVVHSLQEVAAFQRQVAANRSAYLADEVRRLRLKIAEREARQASLAEEQQAGLQLLRSGGALDDFMRLQGELVDVQNQLVRTQDQIDTLRELSVRKSRLKSEELELASRTKLDLQERFQLRSGVVARFAEIMDALYGVTADLVVTPGKGGLKFSVKLPTEKVGSDGVGLMAIFAYDVALSEDMAIRDLGPKVLVHDSGVFADVDERQRARAIEIADASATSFGYQHILAINSDNVPWNEFVDKSVFESSIVLTLNDGSPSGSVLGMRLTSSPEMTSGSA